MDVTLSNLRHAANQLPEKDQDFCRSLIAGWEKYGNLTSRQHHWAGVLIERAFQPAPVAAKVVESLQPVLDLFAHAAQRLKQPGFRFATARDLVLRIKVAGSSSRNAGDLYVLGDGSFEERAFYGRVDRSGVYHPGRDAKGQAGDIAEALAAFGRDPEAAALSFARKFGRCCYCNLPLTDERSTEVGYGQTCAKNWGRPWGSRPARKAKASACGHDHHAHAA